MRGIPAALHQLIGEPFQSAHPLLRLRATPIGGGHYLVDVLAGLGLGVASIPVARRLTQLQAIGVAVLERKPYLGGGAPSF